MWFHQKDKIYFYISVEMSFHSDLFKLFTIWAVLQELFSRGVESVDEVFNETINNNYSYPHQAPKIIHFVHIPKTGGSSFGLILKRFIGAQKFKDRDGCSTAVSGGPANNHGMIPCGSVSTVVMTPNCSFLVGCVTQHQPKMNFLEVPSKLRVSVTMLRNPVRRVVSAFFHGWPHTPKDCNARHGCSMHKYLDMPQYQNIAVRMLGANSWPYNITSKIDDTCLKTAQDNLARFQFIGLTEAFFTSFKLMFAVFNWGRANGYFLSKVTQRDCLNKPYFCGVLGKKNKNNDYSFFLHNNEQNAALQKHIEATNALDMQLYATAKMIFCSQLKKFYNQVVLHDTKVKQELKREKLCFDDNL